MCDLYSPKSMSSYPSYAHIPRMLIRSLRWCTVGQKIERYCKKKILFVSKHQAPSRRWPEQIFQKSKDVDFALRKTRLHVFLNCIFLQNFKPLCLVTEWCQKYCHLSLQLYSQSASDVLLLLYSIGISDVMAYTHTFLHKTMMENVRDQV